MTALDQFTARPARPADTGQAPPLREASRLLAWRLAYLRTRNPVVLGIPRRGVVVGREVAKALHAPLDVVLVHKIFAPGPETHAIGAVGEGGITVIDKALVAAYGVLPDEVTRSADRVRAELAHEAFIYRRGNRPVSLAGKTVVLTDDGIETGSTINAAVDALRAREPARLIVAVVNAPAEKLAALAEHVDRTMSLFPIATG